MKKFYVRIEGGDWWNRGEGRCVVMGESIGWVICRDMERLRWRKGKGFWMMLL